MAEKKYNVAAELIVKTRKWKEGMLEAKKSTQTFMKDFKQATKDSTKELDKLAKDAENTFKSIKTGAKVAGAAIVGMFAAGTVAGSKFNAEMERSITSYETLLKSTDKAKKMVSDLLALSEASPFEFRGLDKSSKLLLAMGFEAEKIIPTMKSIGDAVSAAGGNTETLEGVSLALGQIQTKGKLSAEEMNQLAERGIPAWEILSDKLNLSTQELMKLGEQGKLFADDIIPALLSGLSERFAGAMEKQNKTVIGMLSNLRETGRIILGEATVEFFNSIKGDISSLTKSINELRKNGKITKWARDAGNALKKMYDTSKQVGSVLVSTAISIKNNWGLIEPVLVGVVSALVAMKIVGTITLLWKGYQKAVAFATVAQHGLNVAMKANPIGFIITLISLLGTAIYYLVKNWDKVKLAFQIGVLHIQKAFTQLRIASGEMMLKLMNTLAPLVEWIGKIAPGIVDGFEEARIGVKQKTEAMAQDVEKLEKRINASVFKMKHGLESFTPGSPTQGLHDIEKMTPLELQRYKASSSKNNNQNTEPSSFQIPDTTVNSGKSPFEKAMSEYRYLVDMSKLSTAEQLKYLQNVKKNYAKTVDDIRSINVELKNKQEELNKESFESSKKWIDQKKYYNKLTLKQELAAWQRVQKRYLQGTDERIEAEREIYRVKQEIYNINSEILNTEKQFRVDRLEKRFERLNKSLNKLLNPSETFDYSELSQSISDIVAELDLIDKRYINGVSFIDSTDKSRNNLKSIRSEILNISKEVERFNNSSSNSQHELERLIRSQLDFADELKDKISDITNLISEKERLYKQEEESLKNQIDTVSDSYDEQIERQRQKLKNLDEEIDKEDRLKKLRQINNELDKVKNDKRFSYITSEGKEILTHNKERALELEKQRDELLQQYEREDIKNAIQEEIDRLQRAKDDTIRTLQDKLEQTRQIHQAEIDSLRLYLNNLNSLHGLISSNTQEKMDRLKELQGDELEQLEGFWDSLIEKAREGTLSYNELMEAWQEGSYRDFKGHVDDMQSQANRLSRIVDSMNSMGSGGRRSGSSNPFGMSDQDFDRYVKNKKDWESGNRQWNAGEENRRLRRRYGIEDDNYSYDDLKKYHNGGWVGGIKNALSSLKNGEIPAILEKGEFVLSTSMLENLSNFKNQLEKIDIGSILNTSLNKNVERQQPAVNKHYHFKDLTVKSDNVSDFLKSVDFLITSEG
jgi:tape measure domain-containing protein